MSVALATGAQGSVHVNVFDVDQAVYDAVHVPETVAGELAWKSLRTRDGVLLHIHRPKQAAGAA